MSRISVDEYYLDIAKAVSKRSSCLKRQYGAVVVNNQEIIATGYNGSPRGEENCCDLGYCNRLNEVHNSGKYDLCKSVHAEQNAIISASRKDMIGGTLYLYGEENGKTIYANPCPICQRMIKNAGIERVVYSSELKEKCK
jgi:dCMP deaminase